MTAMDLQQDVREAWRSVRRSKAFSITAIMTLALGISGTTVMFTLVHGVLLRPLPVRDQDRVIVAWKELRASGFMHYPFDRRAIDEVARESRSIESAAGVGSNGSAGDRLIENGASIDVDFAVVTGEFFNVLQVRPIAGRTLQQSDDVDGAERVVVIGEGLWHRVYGGSRDVIGRRITLGQARFTIVGVMPRDFDYPVGVDVWRPTHTFGTDGPFGDAARREVDLIARLRPGVTVEQATGELVTLTRQFESGRHPGVPRGLLPVVHPFEDVVVGSVRPGILALFAAVALVLLIASANAANLLLMRSESRRTELAIREALGAGRIRIVRQVLAETLLLAIAAAAAAALIGWSSLRTILSLLPDGLPRIEAVRFDGAVLLFTLAAGLVSFMIAGLGPAVAAMRSDPAADLQSGGRGGSGSRTRQWRRTLVVGQVALAVAVVAAAGLLIRTVLRLQAIDIGLAADRLVFVQTSLPNAKYATRARHAQFLDEALAQLEAVPQVAAATAVNVSPFAGDGGWDVPQFTAEGQTAEQAAVNPSLNLESIDPGYFRTFEIPMRRGRAFSAGDREGALDAAIVSEDVAAWVWPGQDPIGRRLRMGGPASRDENWLTIVGVAASTRYRDLARPRPTLYLPAAQFQMTAQTLVVRTTAPVDFIAGIARERLRLVEPDIQVLRIAPFNLLLQEPLARPRFNALVLGIFGTASLLLTTIGIYAVIAAHVRQRGREIAVRVALGATAMHLRRLVLGEALWLAGVGAVVGLAAAAAASRSLQGLLFEVDPLDPITLLGAAVLLMILVVLASYVPMRRAVRADAVEALRG